MRRFRGCAQGEQHILIDYIPGQIHCKIFVPGHAPWLKDEEGRAGPNRACGDNGHTPVLCGAVEQIAGINRKIIQSIHDYVDTLQKGSDRGGRYALAEGLYLCGRVDIQGHLLHYIRLFAAQSRAERTRLAVDVVNLKMVKICYVEMSDAKTRKRGEVHTPDPSQPGNRDSAGAQTLLLFRLNQPKIAGKCQIVIEIHGLFDTDKNHMIARQGQTSRLRETRAGQHALEIFGGIEHALAGCDAQEIR